ncbi:MAG TPA: hypothetical protein VNW92_30910, partial [Polyangiaceae bacterium]|nr:hypothetical protein [Polyangiaceae bacterium]
MMGRRSALLLLLSALLPALLGACGGPNSRLVTVRTGGGSGPVIFTVKNATDVPINALYLAKTEKV